MAKKTARSRDPFGLHGEKVRIEAEVNKSKQADFDTVYKIQTKEGVRAGVSPAYQDQPNKWGGEYRLYFNNDDVAKALSNYGCHVEQGKRLYRKEYKYRVNSASLFWMLVIAFGYRLGDNDPY